MFNFIKNLFKKNYESLSAADFKAGLSKDPKAVLLDVRSPGEFAGDKIKGAKNIPVSSADFGKKIAALDNSKSYYVYCRSGARSGMACSQMTLQGLQAYNLSGGIMSWPY